MESPDLDEALKDYVNQSILDKIMTGFRDVLVLKNS